jgi:hypothetical protein
MNATSLVTLTLAALLASTAARAQQAPGSEAAGSTQSAASSASAGAASTGPGAAGAAAASRSGHIERNAQEDLEPAVDTSSEAQTRAAAPAAGTAAPAPAPAAQGAAHPADGHTPPRVDAAPKAAGKATDRIELDTTSITGNRELPKVMYIVPWKNSDLGDLVGKPVNSLLDEVLEPVDRDVFKRENRYYRAVAAGETHGSGNGADAVRQGAASSAQAAGPGARDER